MGAAVVQPERTRRWARWSAVRIVLGIAALLIADTMVGAVSQLVGPARGSLPWLGLLVVRGAALLGAYAAFVRVVEHRAVEELDRGSAAPQTVAGLAAGAGLMAVTALAAWLLGAYELDSGGGVRPVLTIGLALYAGVFEELAVRGVLFRILEQRLGTWIALALSAVAFGALHAGNDGATLVSMAAVALEAGVLLAAVYVLTRRLWAAIGLHAAWNATQGLLFGSDGPGTLDRPLLEVRPDALPLLTGSTYGIEASIIAVAFCLAAATLLLVLAVRRGRIVAPSWRRSH